MTDNLIPFMTDVLSQFGDMFGSDFLLKENHIELKIYVPGLVKEDLSVSYDSSTKRLLIKNKNKLIESYRIRNTNILDFDKSSAELKAGILYIKIPRIKNETKIKIK